jgi:molecular chaperone DnaK (HSP70)
MRLGIDFGTSSSRAALLSGDSFRFVKEPLRHGSLFPSSAFVTKEREILVGYAAENRRKLDLRRYQSGFKRDLGAVRAENPYRLGEREFLPEDLVAAILNKLKSEADQTLSHSWNGGRPFTGAVLTVPATYQRHKLTLMRQAAEAARLQPEEVAFLDEPTAAVTYYAWQQERQKGQSLKEDDVLLVYDFGGGTFDAALIQKVAGGYEPLTQALGLERCGGIDFDREIYRDIAKRHLIPEGQSPEALFVRAMLIDACQEVKVGLSEAPACEVMLPLTPGVVYELTREAFDGLIAGYVEETWGVCRQLVKNAGLGWDRVSGVLLVGGSCRVPYVRESVKKELGRPVFSVDDPELAVCQGAAIFGADAGAEAKEAPPIKVTGVGRPRLATRVVDALCRGDHVTLNDALKVAKPGDRILVRPGLYKEGVVIDKPVEIIGEGDLGEVVIEATGKDVVLFQASIGLIANLT